MTGYFSDRENVPRARVEQLIPPSLITSRREIV